MRAGKSALLITTALWGAISVSGTAQEQEANATRGDPGVGEIIVTAQKREQKLTDVGISIVAASADQLATRGISDASDLGRIASGFSAAKSTHNYPIYSIRGINFTATQISAAPAVATYVDEAALPYSSMTAGLLLDVDHVEVLKGPQGTLFGQNATGGAINAVAARPTDDLRAGLRGSVNHFGQVDLNGFISGPISDTLKARLAFTTTQFGEWQKGYYASDERWGDQNRGIARLLLDFTPSDRVRFSLNVNAGYDHSEPQLIQMLALAAQNLAALDPFVRDHPLGPNRARAAEASDKRRNRDHTYQTVLRGAFDLTDDIVLTSITNYIDNRHDAVLDADATTFRGARVNTNSSVKSFGQELRLTGNFEDAGIVAILGGNYQNDKIHELDRTNEYYASSIPPDTILHSEFWERNRSAAVFGNIDWEVMPRLTLTGGLRYTKSRQSTCGCSYDDGDGSWAGFLGAISDAIRGAQGLPPPPAGAFVPGGCATLDDRPTLPGGLASFLPAIADQKQTEDNLSWRAGLNFKPTPDALIYGLVSRGYKSGVFPFQHTVVVSQVRPVKQEQLTSFEVGAKGDLMDRALSVAASAFYYKYRDKQFFTYVRTPFIGVATTAVNIPNSTVKGFDAEVTARSAQGLTLHGAVAYVKTRIGTFVGLDVSGTPLSFTGREFNYAPPWTANGDVDYRIPVSGDLDLSLGGSLTYNSRTFADLGNSAISRIRAYTLLDARIGLASEKGWTASLWVRNLTDKFYWTSIGTGSDALFRYTGLPRTFGITFGTGF